MQAKKERTPQTSSRGRDAGPKKPLKGWKTEKHEIIQTTFAVEDQPLALAHGQ